MIQNIKLNRFESNSALKKGDEKSEDHYIQSLMKVDYMNLLNKIDDDSLFIDIYYLDQTDKYIMFCLSNEREIQLIDLGDASKINLLIEAYRESIIQSESSHDHRTLSKELMTIFFSFLEGQFPKKIVISTVNELSKLPFETLMDEDGFFLIEKIFIKYISSVKDVIEDKKNEKNKTISIISNPDFNYPFEELTPAVSRSDEGELSGVISYRSICPDNGKFESIRGIQNEGGIVEEIMKQKQLANRDKFIRKRCGCSEN